MKYKISNKTNEAEVVFTVDLETWEEKVNEAYKKNAKRFNVQGFRKGSAPKKMIERMYGEGVFFEDSFDLVINSGIRQFFSENEKIKVVGRPELTAHNYTDDGKAVKDFTVKFTLYPEVKISAYKGIKIPKYEYNVKADDIEKEVDALRDGNARINSITDRVVKKGDTVVLDFSGSIDGVKFQGGTAEKHTLEIGSGSFIPGFEDKLIGAKPLEEKAVEVSFPKNYHAKELAGKVAVFDCFIHEIQEKVYPEISDELVKDSSSFGSLDEFRADAKERLQKAANEKSKRDTEQSIIDAVLKNAAVSIPKVMLDECIEDEVAKFERQVTSVYKGLKIEDYYKATKTTKEEHIKQITPSVKVAILSRLVISHIIDKEGIKKGESANDTIDNLFDFLSKNNTLEPTDEDAAKNFEASYKQILENIDGEKKPVAATVKKGKENKGD